MHNKLLRKLSLAFFFFQILLLLFVATNIDKCPVNTYATPFLFMLCRKCKVLSNYQTHASWFQ